MRRARLSASAAARRRAGGPQQHDCLSYSYLEEPDEWHLIGRDGERVVKVSGPIVTSHRQVLRDCRRARARHRLWPVIFFRDDLDAGRAAQVLPDFELPEATIYAVYPASQQLSAKVRGFNDFMARYFAASPIFAP